LNQILTEMDGFADGSADGLGADGSLRTDGSADHGSGGGGAARGGTKGAKSVQSNSVLVVAATNRPEVFSLQREREYRCFEGASPFFSRRSFSTAL